jgi:hypothetical protein
MVCKGSSASRSMDQFTPPQAIKNCVQLRSIFDAIWRENWISLSDVNNGKFYEMYLLRNAQLHGM